MNLKRLVLVGLVVADCRAVTTASDPVDRVEIDSPAAALWVDDTVALHATPRSAAGTPLLDRPVRWASSDSTILRVSAAGLMAAVGPGSATITAAAERKLATVTVDVYAADLLYEGQPAGLPEIMFLPLRSGAPVRLLPPYTLAGHPSATSDGARIAFVVTDTNGTTDIHTSDRDGSHITRLTFDADDSDQPSWSPDGSRIAFHSTRAGRAGDIWIMGADGSSPVNLTPDPLPGVTDETSPAWSPDGGSIAYVSNAGGTTGIWVMQADGAAKHQLTTGWYDADPAWSPDGGTIAFRRAGAGESDIMLVAAGGGIPVRLALPGDDRMPAWSPDGRLIVFARFPGGNPQLYTVRPDGSDLQLRTTDYTWNGGRRPTWIRDR